MAKKFVRGITDVKTINNQDYDTNNVNDLLSDGQYNYIHRKKGKKEEYHNLTDNIKTISSDNTELLSVTNNNKTTNTATLSPKHDAQKEQVLESTRDTVTINHGTNGTDEKTTVDTNPKKVLEHENLLTDYGISKKTTGNTTTLGLEYTKVEDGFDLNELSDGCIRGNNMLNAPYTNTSFFVEAFSQANFAVQIAYHMGENIPKFHRFKASGAWSAWRQQVGDKSTLDSLLEQKQNKLTAGDGLAIENNEIKIKPKNVETLPANSGFYNGAFMDGEWGNPYASISLNINANKFIQLAFRESVNTSGLITAKYRFIVNNVPTGWKEMTLDSAAINSLLAQKQDVLTAGDGITIEGNTISATAAAPVEGATVSIQDFAGNGFNAYKHVVTSGGKTLVTFSFQCNQAETVITDALKQQLENFIPQSATVSNGALSITRDGADIKLLNSAASPNVYQHGTFTFVGIGGGGEPGGGTIS